MDSARTRFAPLRWLLSLVFAAVLLVLEVALTMLVYTGLNVYSLDLFGTFVRLARSVLDVTALIVEKALPGSANTAYATLFGELGPKSILLLLIGLVVAALLRSIAHLIGRLLPA